jgi:hypothetical protein
MKFAALAFIAALPAAGQTISTFANDAEGWGTFSDARDFRWDASLGNPAGSIIADDVGTGATWYFSASDAYLGDQSGALANTFSFDILGVRGNQTFGGIADVVIVGADLEIGIILDVAPGNGQWTSWSVIFSETEDWRFMTDIPNAGISDTQATQADLAAALADLQAIYIRGEYSFGSDSTALDNVVLVPAPTTLAVSLGMLSLGLRRRRA